MPNTDKVQWPQGEPQFEVHWRAVAEALGGNGVVASGDLQVTATANAMEIQVDAGDAWYGGAPYNHGSAATFTLTAADGSNDRWDTVYFDTATASAGVRDGTAASNPEPPDIQADEILLATIYVPANATDVPDSQILNWRTHSTDADNTYLKDSGSEFSSDTVEGAFGEVIREQGDPLTGPLDLSSFSGSAPFDLGTNPGEFGAIVGMVVDSNSAAGTAHSYHFAIDATNVLEIYAESDGAGGVQNAKIQLHQLVEVDGDIQTNGGTTIWDSTNGFVPNEQVQALANFTADETFSAYPLVIGTDVANHLAGGDLLAASGGNAVYDSTAGHVPRARVDDERIIHTETASGTNGSYVTSGEEVILVDTATNSTAFTVTLASADVASGNFVTVIDIGGGAGANAITINTEGTETIDGGSSVAIEKDNGAKVVMSNGTNWFTAGGGGGGVTLEDDQTAVTDPATAISAGTGLSAADDGDTTGTLDYEHAEVFEGRESGSVSSGNQGILVIDSLADGETVEVYKAALTNADGSAVASGVDLELVTLDNAGAFTSQSVLITGDGSTVFDDETGSPLGSYTNTSGAAQSIGVLVDNGTAGSVNIIAVAEGITGV